MHLSLQTVVAERQAFAIARARPLLDTEAIIYASFTSECTVTATLCTVNTAVCYRACATRYAASMQLLPVWQGIHRLASTVEALRARTPQLGRGGETHNLGSGETRSSALTTS